MARRIAVITGTRAEYGLLYWTLRELQERKVDLQLIVTGAHLSPDHGLTVKQIEADGFPIAAKVDMKLTSDKPAALAASMGTELAGMAEAFERLKPEMAVILGDRYEMLTAATAALMMNIPIAHIHGGDVTAGAIDDSIRHAITKLSYWHFPSAEAYAKRVIQLGEEPSRVFNVGEPGIDNLMRLKLPTRPELEKALGITLSGPVLLFTYHPETLSPTPVQQQIDAVLAALKNFPEATLLMSGANADSGGRLINAAVEKFAVARPKSLFRLSFSSPLYLAAMREADGVVGNSSSGVIEAPALGKASVNIGNRQAGRLRAPGVIDCDCSEASITAALKKALSNPFKQTLSPCTLFGTPGKVAAAIADKLTALSLPSTPVKRFHDC